MDNESFLGETDLPPAAEFSGCNLNLRRVLQSHLGAVVSAIAAGHTSTAATDAAAARCRDFNGDLQALEWIVREVQCALIDSNRRLQDRSCARRGIVFAAD